MSFWSIVVLAAVFIPVFVAVKRRTGALVIAAVFLMSLALPLSLAVWVFGLLLACFWPPADNAATARA